jgi:hypothetical protein
MDLNDVETIRYNALAGADNITLADMTGSDLVDLTVDLGASAGGGDGQADRVTLFGNSLSDNIAVTAGSSILVSGLFTNVQIEDAEAIDRLILAMGSGNDTVNTSGLAAGQIIVELRGDLGADTLIGSEGGDFFFGGDGNDTALMGAGDDISPGIRATTTTCSKARPAPTRWTSTAPTSPRTSAFRPMAAASSSFATSRRWGWTSTTSRESPSTLSAASIPLLLATFPAPTQPR